MHTGSTMSPDLEKAILEALQAGKSIRAVAAEVGKGVATVHRVAKAHGIVNGTRPKKRKARRNGTAERNTEHGTEQGESVPARVPVLPDPDLVDDHFQSMEVLQETISQLEGFAKFGKVVADMARGLATVVQRHCWVKNANGDLALRDGVKMSEARQAAGLLEQVAKAGEKGINIYRKSRGLYDKQRHEHSGRIEGTRGEDTIATYVGFALQGALRGSPSVPEGIPGGQGKAEDLDREQEDRQEFPDSN